MEFNTILCCNHLPTIRKPMPIIYRTTYTPFGIIEIREKIISSYTQCRILEEDLPLIRKIRVAPFQQHF